MSKSKPNEELPEVTQYLASIRRYKMLTPEEEVEVGKRIERGEEKAVNELVNANLRYVVAEAKRYRASGVPFSDLISEGNLGLVKAAKRFDWRRGVKFISYAVWYIRQSIFDLIKTFACDTEYSECDFTCNVMPYEQMLAVTADAYDSESAFVDVQSRGDILSSITKCLKEKELSVLQMYFGLNGKKSMTLLEIGEQFGITKERVRQIKDKAMVKLRSSVLVSDEFDVMRNLC